MSAVASPFRISTGIPVAVAFLLAIATLALTSEDGYGQAVQGEEDSCYGCTFDGWCDDTAETEECPNADDCVDGQYKCDYQQCQDYIWPDSGPCRGGAEVDPNWTPCEDYACRICKPGEDFGDCGGDNGPDSAFQVAPSQRAVASPEQVTALGLKGATSTFRYTSRSRRTVQCSITSS